MGQTGQLDILHVIDSLGQGGAEQNLLSLVRRMPQGRYRHHLAWLFDDVALLERFRPHVASLLPLHAGHGLGLLTAAGRLARWVRRNRPTVIHSQLVRAQLVARTASVMCGGWPLVTTWQSDIYASASDFGGERRRELIRWLDRMTSPLDRHFIAVSDHVAHRCADELGVAIERVSVVHNAVEPDRYRHVDAAALQALRDELGLDADTRVLLSVGRLVPTKAHETTIAAMQSVAAREPHALLFIAGDGPLRAALQADIDARGLGRHVRLLGARSDIAALYQLSQAFVFPSVNEGLSVALLEALANGLPAIVSDIPQNREVANGLSWTRFVRPGDTDGFAAAILDVLGAGDAARDGMHKSRDEVRTRFAPDRLAVQFGAVLERAAGR